MFSELRAEHAPGSVEKLVRGLYLASCLSGTIIVHEPVIFPQAMHTEWQEIQNAHYSSSMGRKMLGFQLFNPIE